jgi:predicted alpha/beta hydrolase family esterase
MPAERPTSPSFPRKPEPRRGFNGVLGFRSSLSFFLCQSIVLVVRSVAPAAVLRLGYVAYHHYLGQPVFKFVSPLNLALTVAAFVEAAFLLASLLRAHSLSRQKLPIPFPKHERQRCVGKILSHLARASEKIKCVDPKDGTKTVPGKCTNDCCHMLLRGWNRGAAWEDCDRTHAESWLSWALFGAEWDALSSYQKTEIAEYLETLCSCTGLSLAKASSPSSNKKIAPIRLSLDSMTWLHRPLIAYFVTDFILGQVVSPLVMWHMGYRRLSNKIADSADVRHWYHPGNPAVHAGKTEDEIKETSDGVFMLHGVGVGYLPYVDLLKRVSQATNGLPTLVIEIPYIALRCWASPDSRGCDATSESIAISMRSVGMERATLVGHSFGTIIASWILRHSPEHVHSAVLIDPVCLQLARADVAFAAIHRKPVSAADVLLEYFVFRELSLAATLARNFIWHRNILWAEDLPDKKRSVGILSSNDVIVPSASVQNYLVDKGVDHVWLEGLGHAGFLKRQDVLTQIVEEIRKRGQERDGGKKVD